MTRDRREIHRQRIRRPDILPMVVRMRRAMGRLSLRQAADQAKVSSATLCRIERGESPDMETLVALAEWTGLTLDYLIFGDFNEPTEPTR